MNDNLTTEPKYEQGHVLVVDDEEANRTLLRSLLEAEGHRVTEAADGKEALEKVVEIFPDVVLLDVMMPRMDGFEACRQLKGSPKTAPIPVLLVTALKERADKLKGIEAGANDFLNKPIDNRDVILRVRNAVYTKHLYDQLEESYNRLRKLEALRDSLTDMIIHDLKSPLTGMRAFLQILQMQIKDKISREEGENLDWAVNLTGSLTTMINSLLDISRLEAGEMPLRLNPGDLRDVAREAVETIAIPEDRSRVVLEEGPEPVRAYFDAEVIIRVIANLVGNALKYSPGEGKVKVNVKADGGKTWVAVTDNGPGIPPEYHEKIFEKFGQVEAHQTGQKRSTGLGLTFCKLAVEAHRGKITVESEESQGSTFTFWLPALKEKVD